MPANLGDITAYHKEEAARHYALAQAARDRGCIEEAEYQAGLAARWEEAAQPPPPMPFAVACLLAVERGVQRIAAALRQSIIKRSASVDGLTLR